MIRKRRGISTITDIRTLRQIHALMIINGFTSNVGFLRKLLLTTAMSMVGPAATTSLTQYARQMFAHIPQPDTFVWNTFIRGSLPRAPIQCMQLHCLHQALLGQYWFRCSARVLKLGFGLNVIVRNTLLVFHAKCGDLKHTRSIGRWKCEWRLFDETHVRDVISWNTIIGRYVLCGLNKEALELFDDMCGVGECLDEVTMLSLLSACSDLGDLESDEKVHSKILEMSKGKLSTLLGNALTDMYGKCGNIWKAIHVFWLIRDKAVISWNTVIAGRPR
ncbi:hypothetical protein VNO78_15005 [Psophocarpus tetragonolobus]|uniref:Pentatricopeptide repeat-containing protein n=1 Tax=Psophocarpus tetragonolobus TaxID=3891 RepID=A0AAN9SE53_PSOTE